MWRGSPMSVKRSVWQLSATFKLGSNPLTAAPIISLVQLEVLLQPLALPHITQLRLGSQQLM